MSGKPPEKPEDLPVDEVERRFNEAVGRLVNTPHKPHKPKGDTPADKRRG